MRFHMVLVHAGVALGIYCLTSPVMAQRRSRDISGFNPSGTLFNSGTVDTRGSSRRDTRNAARSTPTPAPSAGKTPAPAAGTKTTKSTVSSTRGTTTGKSLAKPGAADKKAGGGYASNAAAGREITKEMAESLRAIRVDYDAEAMSQKPSVIILNPRRYNVPGYQTSSRPGTEVRSLGGSTDLVDPL